MWVGEEDIFRQESLAARADQSFRLHIQCKFNTRGDSPFVFSWNATLYHATRHRYYKHQVLGPYSALERPTPGESFATIEDWNLTG